MRGLRIIAAWTALALLLGLHWTVLQTVAWTRMLVDFSRSLPIGQAISMTFDGRHPCSLCRSIQQGRQTERDQTPATIREAPRWECDLPIAALFDLDDLVPPSPPTGRPSVYPSRRDDPPTPPPRRPVIA